MSERQFLGDSSRKRALWNDPPETLAWSRRNPDDSVTEVTLGPNSRLSALNELKQACETGRYTMNKRDTRLLDSWIDARYKNLQAVIRKARSLKSFDLEVNSRTLTIGPDKPLEALQSVWHANATGKIVLKDEESVALTWWISSEERQRERKNSQKDRHRSR